MASIPISALPESTLTTDMALPGVEGGVTKKMSNSISGTQVVTALGFAPAPLASPVFTGDPRAPTPATGDNDTSISTTAFVKAQGYVTASTAPVTSVAGRTGDVVLTVSDVSGAAPIASPTFTGAPHAPTPNPSVGISDPTRIATMGAILAFGFQSGIQFQDEGSNLGSQGTETVVNFTGVGVTATDLGGTITVTIPGGGGGTVTSVDGSGGTTGLILTGGPITTTGTLTLGGTLNIASGGTGANSAGTALSNLGGQKALQFQDEGSNIGSSGTETTVNFTGTGVTATESGGLVTVTIPGSSGGTVTSVSLSAPGAVFAVGGSPVTGSGTLALSFQNQSPNLVFAGPASGGAAAPTFRALGAADIPAGALAPRGPGCSFTNGGLLLANTITGEVQVPYGGTLIGWTIVGDASGSASIVVSRSTYANYNTMTTLFTATVSGALKNQATGLSNAITAGDILRFSGSGFAGFTRCAITLTVQT